MQKLNKRENNYWTFPVLINLSEKLDENYKLFIEKLNMDIRVSNYQGSYAMFKLSEYMLKNYDFENARKFAGLALRYSGDDNFNYILTKHFNKTKWFLKSAKEVISTFKYSKTN